jgi:hypothetical protein
VSDGADEL